MGLFQPGGQLPESLVRTTLLVLGACDAGVLHRFDESKSFFSRLIQGQGTPRSEHRLRVPAGRTRCHVFADGN
jgi:hypothetical protein